MGDSNLGAEILESLMLYVDFPEKQFYIRRPNLAF